MKFLLVWPVLVLMNCNVMHCEPLLRVCEPIRVDLCTGLGYNMTGMPNLGGNDLQHEADYMLKSFSPLIQYGCSSQLKLFLCSVYVPMCTEKVANPIGPCRGLCESVRSRCYPVLKGFGFPWPDALNCSRFPVENNQQHMCMEGPKDYRAIDVTGPVDPAVQKFHWAGLGPGGELLLEDGDRAGTPGGGPGLCAGRRRMFDEQEKRFAEVWVTVWALICFVTSTGSALTLAIGGGRVRAGPLVSLSFCYCLLSVGWIVRVFSGRMSHCAAATKVLSAAGEGSEELQMADDGLSDITCAFVFLLVYYFGMAASAWWVCLCGWWTARVGLCWSPEKMRGLGSVLHLCAWGLPAIQTVAALVIRDVDSDELTGTCYIGNRNPTTLLTLVLLPDLFYLIFGIFLLVAGCYYVLRSPRANPAALAPLTAPAPRKESDFLGAICTVYAIPLFCQVATLYYQYTNADKWQQGTSGGPALWVFLLHHLMTFFVGGSSVFWICSAKSWHAWRSLARRIVGAGANTTHRKQMKMQAMLPVLRYVPAAATQGVGGAASVAGSVTAAAGNGARHVASAGSLRSSTHSHRKMPRTHHLTRVTGNSLGGETVI